MKQTDQYKGIVRFWAAALWVLIQTGIFAYVWFNCYGQIIFAKRGNFVIIGLYAMMVYVFLKLYGGLRFGKARARELLYSQFLSIACVNLVTYLQLCMIGRWSHFLNVAPIIGMTVVDMVAVTVWILTVNRIYKKLYPPRRLLVVYDRHVPERLIQKLHTRKDKYTVSEIVSSTVGMEAIFCKMEKYDAVLLGNVSADTRDLLLKHCFNNGICCYVMPDISDIMFMGAEKVQLSDMTLLFLRNQGLSAGERCIKRIFDIVVGLIAVIIAAPVMLIIAAAIKLYDGGPVFFVQNRLTRDGKVFSIYKFRSMRVQREDEENCITRKNDDRITPIGHVIRKLHLDELPQILNIIKGDMSFVGPRPEWTATTEQYSQNLPEFLFRLKVKAGLTGYAQVYGKYNTTPYDKLLLDLTYIEKYSFLLDLKLMFLTLKILFQKENTEGIEAWQTSAEVQSETETR